MKIKFIWFCFILSVTKGYSHDTHVAFFEIREIDSLAININADFPWTLRDALIQYDSILLSDRREETWETSFARYVSQHLIIYDINHRQLRLLSIENLRTRDRGHSVQYQFQFEKGIIRKIENRLMFNINLNQTNYHSIFTSGTNIVFTTNLHAPNFILENQKALNLVAIIWIFGGIFLSLLLVVTILLKKKNKNTSSDATKVYTHRKRYSK